MPPILSARKRAGIARFQGKGLYVNPCPHITDFTRPALYIAREQGISYYRLLRYMRENGIPVRKKGSAKGTVRTDAPLYGVIFDWSHRDAPLGVKHHCTRERIRQLRKKAGEPPSGSKEWREKYHSPTTSQQPDT